MEDERRHVGERHARDAGGVVGSGAEAGARPHRPGGRVVHDRHAVAARHDQPALERNRRDRDHAVAAHRAVALVVHEEHAGVRAGRDRLGEERAVHVGMAAGLEHQRAPQVVGPLLHPVALLEHRPADRRGKAVDDETQRLAGGVRVDGLQSNRGHIIAMLVIAFYSDTFVLPLPEAHRFPMAKYRRLRERLLAEGVLRPDELRVPDAASWHDLRLVHDPAYLEAAAAGTLPPEMQRRIGFPWSSGDGRAIAPIGGGDDRGGPGGARRRRRRQPRRRHAPRVPRSGRGLLRVQRRRRRRARPPPTSTSSHASRSSIATSIRATAPPPSSATTRRSFTCSFHGANNFPFRKETSDLDVTFADGAGDEEYLSALARHVPAILDAERPDIVFYLAGADPFEGDRLGRLGLTIDGLRERDRLVFDACRDRAIPVAVAMSGGYAPDVEAIVTIHVNTIREASKQGSTGSGERRDLTPRTLEP